MKFLFLDTETTGKEDKDRLIQICYKFPVADPVTYLFKPPVPISFEAMATHHITEKMVEGKPAFKGSEYAKIINEFLSDSVLIAHNAKFDIEMLRREGVEVKDYICTMKICQHLIDSPSYKLQYLRYKLGLEVEARAHDAEGDVIVLEALFNKLCAAEFNDPDYIEWMIELSSQPLLLRRIAFGRYQGQEFKDIPRSYLEWLNRQPGTEDLKFTINHWLK